VEKRKVEQRRAEKRRKERSRVIMPFSAALVDS
jgi:hypothetical protein